MPRHKIRSIKTLTGNNNLILCLMSLPNNRIASGSGDKTIKIWDINSLECIKTLTGHNGSIWCLISLPNNRIASGSDNKTIKSKQ
jgi:WD40 repeat protein